MDRATAYTVLGISSVASGREIKRAYRRLATQFHPDRNPADEKAKAQFKEVTAAYNFLTDVDVSVAAPVIAPPASFRSAFVAAAHQVRVQPSPPATRTSSSPVFDTDPFFASRSEALRYFYSRDTDHLATILRAREAHAPASLDSLLGTFFPQKDTPALVATVTDIFTDCLEDVAPVLFYAQRALGEDAPVDETLALGRTLLTAPHFEAMVGAGSFCRALSARFFGGPSLSALGVYEVFSRLYHPVALRWQGKQDLSSLDRLLKTYAAFAPAGPCLAQDPATDALVSSFISGFSLADAACVLTSSSSGIDFASHDHYHRHFASRFPLLVHCASDLLTRGYSPAAVADLFSLAAQIQHHKFRLRLSTLSTPERFAKFVDYLALSLAPDHVALGKDFVRALRVGARGYLNQNFPFCAQEWRDALSACLPATDALDAFVHAQGALSQLYYRLGYQGAVERERYGQGLHVPVLWAAEAGAKLALRASLPALDSFGSFLAGYRETRYHPQCRVNHAVTALSASQREAYSLLRRAATRSRDVQGLKVARGKLHSLEISWLYEMYSSA